MKNIFKLNSYFISVDDVIFKYEYFCEILLFLKPVCLIEVDIEYK